MAGTDYESVSLVEATPERESVSSGCGTVLCRLEFKLTDLRITAALVKASNMIKGKLKLTLKITLLCFQRLS